MDIQVLQMAGIIISSLIGLGALVAGSGYAYAKFFQGKNDKTKDDLELFTKQLDALRKVCDEQTTQINALQADLKQHTQEIGRLQGINEEKEKKIKELTDLLANRDPALLEYMKFSRDAIKDLTQGLKDIYKYIEDVDSKVNKHITNGKIE